jgi:hypothetical protein
MLQQEALKSRVTNRHFSPHGCGNSVAVVRYEIDTRCAAIARGGLEHGSTPVTDHASNAVGRMDRAYRDFVAFGIGDQRIELRFDG